jgi:hypothetical protein
LIRRIWDVLLGFLIGLFAGFVGSIGVIFGGLFAFIAFYALPLGDGVWIFYAGFALAGAPSLYLVLRLGRQLATDQRASVATATVTTLLYFVMLCVAVAYRAVLPT